MLSPGELGNALATVPRDRITENLALMRKPADTRVSLEIGRDEVRHTGSPAGIVQMYMREPAEVFNTGRNAHLDP